MEFPAVGFRARSAFGLGSRVGDTDDGGAAAFG